jgi:hypothetical protein
VVAARQAPGERQEALDQQIPGARVAGPAQVAEQRRSRETPERRDPW